MTDAYVCDNCGETVTPGPDTIGPPGEQVATLRLPEHGSRFGDVAGEDRPPLHLCNACSQTLRDWMFGKSEMVSPDEERPAVEQ